MTRKLNSYILTDELKEVMRKRLYETRDEKREKGFTLCSKLNNVISARGDHKGDQNKIKIDPEVCYKDEKFLGGYHTHLRGDSNPSITDLSHCGVHKIVCIGGVKDDEIKCQIWKQKQISKEDALIIAKDLKNNKQPTKEYKINYDCQNNMSILAEKEDILVGMDKNIDNIKSFLSILNKPLSIDLQNKVIFAVNVRDTYANKLKEEIKNESQKYYNEVEIK